MSDQGEDLPTNVRDLNTHVPQEVRQAARAAYLARRECQRAQIRMANAMRALSKACQRFHVEPGDILVGNASTGGELSCMSLVPASHYPDLERGE